MLVLCPLLAPVAVAQEPLTRIAFASCAHQAEPQPIWAAVQGYRPELFIFAGDNVYGDVTSAAMRELEAAYARAATIKGHSKRRQATPVLATWDDHDFGANDFGANDGGADFPHKAAAKRLFLVSWQVPPDDPRRAREGIYHVATFGPEGMRVQVVLLDTRTFRSPLKNRKAARGAGAGAVRPGSRSDQDPCSARRSGPGCARSCCSPPTCA